MRRVWQPTLPTAVYVAAVAQIADAALRVLPVGILALSSINAGDARALIDALSSLSRCDVLDEVRCCCFCESRLGRS